MLKKFKNMNWMLTATLIIAATSCYVAFTSSSSVKSMEKQIQLIHKQNSFSNYYKHKEEFFKILKNLEKELSIEFQNKNDFYRKLFPNSSTSKQNFAPSKDFIFELKDDYKTIISFLTTYNGDKQDFLSFFKSLYSSSLNHYNFRVINGYKVKDKLEINKTRDYIIAYDKDNILIHLDIIYSVLDNILYFANVNNNLKKTLLGNEKFEEHISFFKIDEEKKEFYLED